MRKNEHRLPNPISTPMFENMNRSRFMELAGIPLNEQSDVDINSHDYQMMIKDLAVAFLVFAPPGFNAHEADQEVHEAVEAWSKDQQHYMYMLQQGATAMSAAAKKLEGMLREDEKESSSENTSNT